MPYDCSPIDSQPTDPIEIRLLDRTKEILKHPACWTRKTFVREDLSTGTTSYCLYGALLRAETEIAGEVIRISDPAELLAHPGLIRGTAFYRVHAALNRVARPWYLCLSRGQFFAMVYNDESDRTLGEVHALIDKARCLVAKRHCQDHVEALHG